MAWPRGTSSSWRHDSFSPKREIDHLADQIDAVDLLGHRVFDLEPGVHLEEVEIFVTIDQELHRPHRLVSGTANDGQSRLAEAPPQLGRDHWRRALLHHLLVAALDRALAFAEVDRIAVPVCGHLDLDVTGAHDEPFDIDPIVAEVRPSLGSGAFKGSREFIAIVDLAHSLAAAAGHRLEQNRQPVLIDKRLELGDVFEGLHHSGNQGHPGFDGELAALGLRTHQPDGGGRRSDPRQPRGLDPFGKIGVLGEEPISGVNEVGSTQPGRFEQAIDIEIALGCGSRSDGKGLIGHEHMR